MLGGRCRNVREMNLNLIPVHYFEVVERSKDAGPLQSLKQVPVAVFLLRNGWIAEAGAITLA